MADKPKWRRYEDLVAHVQSELAPDAEVLQDQLLPGSLTGTDRQIDVLIRQHVGQYEVLVVIDCKDWRRPVDVNGVGQFIDVVKDVGANKGVMVAAAGFSRAAKERAQRAGIELYRVVDPGDHDWKADVTIPAVVDLRRLDKFSLRFSGVGRFKLYPQDVRFMTVYDDSGEVMGSVQDLLSKRWREEGIPTEPGVHEEIHLAEEDTYLKSDGEFHRVGLQATVIVTRELYFAQVPITEVKGFQDEIQGGVIARSFVTAGIDTLHIERDWDRIESVEELAVRPLITFVFCNALCPTGAVDKGTSDGV